MERRIYHGEFALTDFANRIAGAFNRGNYQVQQFGDDHKRVVQIATKNWIKSGGQTAITVAFQKMEDGVTVEVGKQAWMGVAASLGISAISVLANPWNLLNRLDDIAQDIESLQLTENIWNVIESTAKTIGATRELSKRLQRAICPYCETPNPVGEPRCIACGAPLGAIQPDTCFRCGFVVKKTEKSCPHCGAQLEI
ncbi:MAG TPA: zinc ribbon domain-containing protein [Anaerolineaceae bacterium]